jgi:hypothetical protein
MVARRLHRRRSQIEFAKEQILNGLQKDEAVASLIPRIRVAHPGAWNAIYISVQAMAEFTCCFILCQCHNLLWLLMLHL